VVNAHKMEAVCCLAKCAQGLVSGGGDGHVCVWDRNLKPIGSSIDISAKVFCAGVSRLTHYFVLEYLY
jgi:hypothetical protein